MTLPFSSKTVIGELRLAKAEAARVFDQVTRPPSSKRTRTEYRFGCEMSHSWIPDSGANSQRVAHRLAGDARRRNLLRGFGDRVLAVKKHRFQQRARAAMARDAERSIATSSDGCALKTFLGCAKIFSM